jgi:PKD repeat protein
MKKIFAFTSLLFLGLYSFGQQADNWCGFDPIIEKKLSDNPNYLNEISQKIQNIREQSLENPTEKAAIYTIPVVFHVIHDGGESNISMAQIESGVEVMNEDFAALNTDASYIRNNADAPFAPLLSDVQVEFKLAKIDPNGNCTNGIQRKFAPNLIDDAGENVKSSANGGLDAWPNDSYMNIWVVNSIDNGGQPGITLGYAFLPYNNWNSGHGILNRHDRIGRIGTAQSNGGRTLTHEMGHICGLLHTFQGECHSSDCSSSGDWICDTPPAVQVFGCSSTSNTCTDVPLNDYFGFDAFDMNENHMAYSSCRYMFTEGQKNLMQNNFESIPNFVSLTSATNLAATGVNLPDVVCISDFSSNKQIICAGETVDFNDMSYHGQTEWTWTFTGGIPATSTDQNPSVVYNSSGTYEVTLEISDGTNNASETKTAFIKVLDNNPNLPFMEGFEDYSDLTNSPWIVENPSGNGIELESNFGHSGTKSIRLDNFGQPSGRLDNIYSPQIDLSSITDDVTLSFRYAYRKRSVSNDEWLRVFISNNCGEDWIQRKTIKGDNLGELTATSFWEPSSIDDWTTVHVTNVTSSYWVENFRLRFEFESDGGNNFFLDDINIYNGGPADEPTLSLNEEAYVSEFNVYPNPASNEANVSFHVVNNGEAVVEIVNAIGQTIKTNNVNAVTGKNLVMLNTSTIESGIYLVRVTVNGAQNVKRLIIQ